MSMCMILRSAMPFLMDFGDRHGSFIQTADRRLIIRTFHVVCGRMFDAGLAPPGSPLTPPDHGKEGRRGRIGLRARTERKAWSSPLKACFAPLINERAMVGRANLAKNAWRVLPF